MVVILLIGRNVSQLIVKYRPWRLSIHTDLHVLVQRRSRWTAHFNDLIPFRDGNFPFAPSGTVTLLTDLYEESAALQP